MKIRPPGSKTIAKENAVRAKKADLGLEYLKRFNSKSSRNNAISGFNVE
jgi:hypothetical protein